MRSVINFDIVANLLCLETCVFTRGPALLAMTAASLAEASPGRCRFGIGAGSPVLAETWNGVPFD